MKNHRESRFFRVGALPFAIFAKLLLCLWLRPRFPCSHQQSERAVPLARSPRDHLLVA